ncbi:hypothetical protein [Clostridium psychrophilum]|uniref:hypothetical protein n=1 Tax=Clostridium psychrophilum TaxID=132926 RepID=UPI001C0C1A46|nr:hypothetical protein [Clostridium psychrophilum]MBU3180579.1 hypothetical protein [Clostridium psychrophilum]
MIIVYLKIRLNNEKEEIYVFICGNWDARSKLMNRLLGIYTPDAGSIFIYRKNMNFTFPKDAIKAGVGTSYQHFKLVVERTARQNILLGKNRRLFLSGTLCGISGDDFMLIVVINYGGTVNNFMIFFRIIINRPYLIIK